MNAVLANVVITAFVAFSDSPDSAIAIANLEALFPRSEGARVEIEIVDVEVAVIIPMPVCHR